VAVLGLSGGLTPRSIIEEAEWRLLNKEYVEPQQKQWTKALKRSMHADLCERLQHCFGGYTSVETIAKRIVDLRGSDKASTFIILDGQSILAMDASFPVYQC
jgi:hypothetical protein